MGSSIYIIGYEPGQLDDVRSKDYRNRFFEMANTIYPEMEKEVLRHYWLAIREKHLEVQLGATSRDVQVFATINSDNVKTRIENCFGNRIGRRYDQYNPLYFIKALEDDNGENIRHYELDLDACDELRGQAPKGKQWGKVNLYLNIDEELQSNMIIAMRSPLMTVWKYRVDVNIGSYAGVLVCNRERGYCNEILRAAESHTHDGWNVRHLEGHGEGYKIGVAHCLLDKIREWVQQQISDLFDNENSECGRFKGMSEYLCFYNPEDASQRASDLNDRTKVLSGETTIITPKEIRRKKSPKGIKAGSVDQFKVVADQDGQAGIGGGGSNGSGGNSRGITNPTDTVKLSDDGNKAPVVTNIDLNMRYFALQEADQWKYVVILSGAERDYDNVILRFTEQQESFKGDNLRINCASCGKINKQDSTKLHNIHIKAGEPTQVEVEFKMNKRRIALGIASLLEEKLDVENE